MSVNEEEVKIRERLVSLETKLDYLSALLHEIKTDIKEQPSREEYEELSKRVMANEAKLNGALIKTGIASTIFGLIGGILIKMLLG